METQYKIDDIKNISSDNDVNNNIKKIISQWGDNIILKVDDNEIPLIFEKHKFLLNDMEFYTMHSVVQTNEYYNTTIFSVDFLNFFVENTKNEAYINNINATQKLRGKYIVKLVLDILESLGVVRVCLVDDAYVGCGNINYKLSLVKMLQYGTTYYGGLGFKICYKNYLKGPGFFSLPEEKIYNIINNTLEKVRSVTSKDAYEYLKSLKELIYLVIDKYGFNKFVSIEFSNYYFTDKHLTHSVSTSQICNLLNDVRISMDIIENSSEKYLYEIMIRSFSSDNCDDYDYLYNMFITGIKGFEYDDNKIYCDWSFDFYFLKYITYAVYYCYDFEKK